MHWTSFVITQNLLGNEQGRAADSIKHFSEKSEKDLSGTESTQIWATRVFFFHYSLATSRTN